jgi:spore cortex formation protein SpoVR/YcgB (stage V sporulation)
MLFVWVRQLRLRAPPPMIIRKLYNYLNVNATEMMETLHQAPEDVVLQDVNDRYVSAPNLAACGCFNSRRRLQAKLQGYTLFTNVAKPA